MKPKAIPEKEDHREEERAVKMRDTVVICKSVEKYIDKQTGRTKEVMKGEMTARYDGEHWTVKEKGKVLGKYTPREFSDAINAKKYVVPGPETSSEWHKAREVFK